MTSLKDQLRSYGNYHRNPTNKLTHFVGVPLVTFSVPLPELVPLRARAGLADHGGDDLLPRGFSRSPSAGLAGWRFCRRR